jgi:enoyl-[acyl-carrier protein] reductase I
MPCWGWSILFNTIFNAFGLFEEKIFTKPKKRIAMGLLKGTKAVVAGVATQKSIAWGIAKMFASEGARIAFLCLKGNVRRVQKLAAQISSDIVIPCDAGDDEEIASAFNEVGRVFDGKLDILVHSIAYADLDDLGGEYIKTNKSGWDKALGISAYSLTAFARQARPMMMANGKGSIITLTFGGGEKVIPGYNIMGVAKAALDMSMRYLAYDLGPDNIRINAISSGPLPTVSSIIFSGFDDALKYIEENSPLLRNISLEDVANTAVFLASNLSEAITGHVIHVDSGMNILGSGVQKHQR